MSNKKPDAKRVDTRNPEEIKAAQRGLLKILAVATFIPNIWVTVVASSGYTNLDQAPVGDENFVLFVVTWGLLSPVVWLACYAYTFYQISKDNMETGAYLPMVPALWFIFWFLAQFVRQSDWFM
jgi:CDP-diglyceride synthetase